MGKRWRFLACWLLAVLVLAATASCGAAADQIIPTTRPTVTASLEPSDTPTLDATATDIPTVVQVAAASTNGPSPTALLGEIPTQPNYTLTPTALELAPGSVQIEYFTTNATSVLPGDTLTLFWSVKGTDKATIYRLDDKGKRGQSWNVDRAGTILVATKPTDKDVAVYLITVGDPPNDIQQKLSVPLKCNEAWFFDPQPTGCPGAAYVISSAVEQTFDKGRMIWLADESRVYVLFNDGQKPAWSYYPDEFKDGQPQSDPSISPPPGKFQPIRGFGLVWRSREHVRDRLGWATAAEISFQSTYQGDGTVASGVIYIRSKEGQVLALSDKGTGWQIVTP